MIRCPTCQTDNPEGTTFCADCGRRLPTIGATTPVNPVASPYGATGAIPQQTVLQDRYIIGQKLGQGGMGAVYRAADRRLSTVTWAVKEMSQTAITSPLEQQQARNQFLREAEMLAGLSHPHLPRVTDHFEQDGKAYLVMEFVPGETLLSFLQREGLPQPVDRVLEWMRQLCDVLEYLHNQQPPIIFRDLKPANMMITPQSQLKLIDFGIARVFKPGQAKDTQAFGTIGYSAPEQYGRGQTDARSDVYSLGVLLHQLLTGYDPSSTPFRLPPASQVNRAVPQHISDVIARATQPDPDQRFSSVRALRDALLGSNQVITRSPSQPYNQEAIYNRASSQPFQQPNPQNQVGSQPFNTPAQNTGLAITAQWIGIVSAAFMLVGTLMVVIGEVAVRGEDGDMLTGFGTLIALAAFFSGILGGVLGVVALIQARTSQTQFGRRSATIGVAGGVVTLLLCCVITYIAASASPS
jgi:serine/threonine-protein kinase